MKALKLFIAFLLSVNAVCLLGLSVYASPVNYEEANLTIPDLEYEIVRVDEDFGMELLVEEPEEPEESEESETFLEEEQQTADLIINARCTAYCSCKKCCGKYAENRPLDESGNEIILTASGERAVQGITVGVDPNVIPLGSKVVIDGHEYIAQDTGNPKVVKNNVIDVYFDNHEDACAFGVQCQEAHVYFPK